MKKLFSALGVILTTLGAKADVKVGDAAPSFSVQTHEGQLFDLQSRKGSWTVLYFYPKADTPGCTKQACAFRDSIDEIRRLGADIFGISVKTAEEQMAFHKKYHLNFTLLADKDAAVAKAYGTLMPVIKISKRWTIYNRP